MSKEEAFNTARKLVKEAVDVAHSAGIDPATVIEPYCPEAVALPEGADRSEGQERLWGDIPVVIDNAVTELFEMAKPDDDPNQQPAFHVTPSTADLVEQDFERYKPSLERMAEDWREEKARFMQEKKANDEDEA